MTKRQIFAALFIVTQIAVSIPWSLSAQTAAPAANPDLEKEIQAKNDRLRQLDAEIQNTQNTLKEVQKQKSSLQQEVKTLDTSIKQLDLRIQADSVATEKLGFELLMLQGDLQQIAQGIDDRKATVAQLFREMQKSDGRNVFLELLTSKNMSDILEEIQSVETLRNRLSIDITKLTDLANSQREKMSSVEAKKNEVQERQENAKNRKLIVEDQKLKRASILQETKSQESEYQSKISQLKAEQDKMEDEIEAIERQLKKNFNTNILPMPQKSVLAWPAESARVTQRYGVLSWLYRGKAHNGLDIGAKVGDAIYAAEDGVVMAVDNNDVSRTRKYQYGRYVMVKHPNNLATLYAHLSQQLVSVGQSVKRGQLIGYAGATGYATGPHLHFGLYWAPSVTFKSISPAAGLVPVGVILNPEDYL